MSAPFRNDYSTRDDKRKRLVHGKHPFGKFRYGEFTVGGRTGNFLDRLRFDPLLSLSDKIA
jgi:hypothetical protein